LTAAPGIFQELTEKLFEVRITAMGHQLYAVKIHSQEISSARMDWRAATEEIRLEPMTVPKSVQRACRAVMRDLGLVFGCFDFIVTPAGEYLFLEVNESGAFLWLEEQLPELRLVDAFCEFLCQSRPELCPSGRVPHNVRLAEVRDAAMQRMKESLTLHVNEPGEHLTEDS
jgi:hypothetical protein